MNILDIDNTFVSLREKVSDGKLVKRILKSLPKRFNMKVTAIEEAQDISRLKVDELIGSLQNFEMSVMNMTDKKDKGIVLVSNIDTEETQGSFEDDKKLSEAQVLLRRQFNEILKQADWKPRSNGQNIRFDISKQQDNLKKTRTDEKNNLSKGVKCHECEGFGHITSKYAIYLKKQKQSLNVS